MPREALGLIETRDMIGAIEVTRAATKAAELVIISAEQNGSGRVTVKIEGSWAAVLAAVEAGARAAEKAGQLVSMHLIGNPDDSLSAILPYQLFIDRYQPSETVLRVRPAPVRPTPTKNARPPVTKVPKKPAPPKAETSRPAVKSVTTKPSPARPAPRPPVTAAPAASSPAAEMPTMADLEAMPVVKLRQFARTLPNLPIQGRQISMANKTQLLEVIQLLFKG